MMNEVSQNDLKIKNLEEEREKLKKELEEAKNAVEKEKKRLNQISEDKLKLLEEIEMLKKNQVCFSTINFLRAKKKKIGREVDG
jgi:hypothetical protein